MFFVDGKFHRQGIGRQLFKAIKAKANGKAITVNSSMYAAEFYRRLGFKDLNTKQEINGISFVPMKF